MHENKELMTALASEEEETFRNASQYHICQQSLDGRITVHDHCDLTGRFRGAAHDACNLQYQESQIIFLILGRYDSLLIINQIATCMEGRIDSHLLPRNNMSPSQNIS